MRADILELIVFILIIIGLYNIFIICWKGHLAFQNLIYFYFQRQQLPLPIHDKNRHIGGRLIQLACRGAHSRIRAEHYGIADNWLPIAETTSALTLEICKKMGTVTEQGLNQRLREGAISGKWTEEMRQLQLKTLQSDIFQSNGEEGRWNNCVLIPTTKHIFPCWLLGREL